MSLKEDIMMRVLDRAHDGPVIEVFKWDTNIIPKTVKKNLQKYNLEKTCDPENPINSNDELADRFYKAGFDMAVETGIYCTTTNRRIMFSEEEILQGLKDSPDTFTLGEGKDLVTYRGRKPEDGVEPMWSCPLSIQVSEEMFLPILEGIARVPEVDVLEGPSLTTFAGSEIRGGSPYELLGGKRHADLTNIAAKNAGREGIGRHCTGTSPTHLGVLGSYGVPGGYKPKRDMMVMLTPAEIKVSYESLDRMCQAFNVGGEVRMLTGSYGYVGGSPGSVEGAIVSNIANSVLTATAYQPTLVANGIFDVRYLGNTDPKAQWALSVLEQALTRNTHLVTGPTINQKAGPVTEMLLYETAVGMMNISASGVSVCGGVRSAGGRFVDYLSPLEHQFGGEIFKACSKMSREAANKIAQKLIPEYQAQITDAPKGQSFQECYDIKTLEPSKEWSSMVDRVKEELKGLGMPLS